MKLIGRLLDVGVGVEAVRGAGIAPQFWIPKTAFNVDDKVSKARTRESYSHIGMDGNQALVSSEWSEGDLEFDMDDRAMGAILYALLGAKSVSGISDSAYTHTFTLANTNQHQSLAIGVKQGANGDFMYKLSMINSLKIVIEPDNTVRVTVSFLGKKSVTSTLTSTYVARNIFVGRHLQFKLATLASGLTAASAIPIKRLELTFDKNTVVDQNLGSSTPTDVLNLGFRISGVVELDYEDRTYRDLMANGSYRAMRIKLTNSVLIGVTSVPTFTLDLSRVDFDQWESDFANDEIAKQTFNFTALYDITNANIINSLTLINNVASY